MKLGEEIPHITKEQIAQILEEAFYSSYKKAEADSRKPRLYIYGKAGIEAFDKALRDEIFRETKNKDNG